jgi:GNAT superfamily N-acetyltransferase
MPVDYRVRPATLADVDVLVRHRIGMFTDMGVPMDVTALDAAFRTWLADVMPAGTYRGWLAETSGGQVVSGAGITVLPWPPGPTYPGNRLAFVYNVYTDPPHRRRGLARLIMEAIHSWCRGAGITSMALNASRDGQPLYEALGYVETPSPMMFFPIVGYNPSAQAADRPTF